MIQVNTSRLLENINERTSIYTPIVEAVVNSIQSIEYSGRKDGEITIKLIRSAQTVMALDDESLPQITSVEIHDNGVGFTDENKVSFETIYGDQKANIGGKGFGRFTYLKYFSEVFIDSTFNKEGNLHRRTFDFTTHQNFVENEKIEESLGDELKTVVYLKNIQSRHLGKLEKKVDTIARQILEKILIYFINDKYSAPKITIEDGSGKQVVLNEYLTQHKAIQEISHTEFALNNQDVNSTFVVKVFKVYHTLSSSAVCLVAHNRLVTTEPLYTYVPEFRDDFYDAVEEGGIQTNKNYSIKAYILGEYLDENVSLEREAFKFSEKSELLYPFSQRDIETRAVEIVTDKFKSEVATRQEKKRKHIKKYVDEEAPWHRIYIDELDLTKIAYKIDNATLESELQKMKFAKEQAAKDRMTRLLNQNEKEIAEKAEGISKELTQIGKSDLAHYVVIRKVVLELLKKKLAMGFK